VERIGVAYGGETTPAPGAEPQQSISSNSPCMAKLTGWPSLQRAGGEIDLAAVEHGGW